VHGSAAKKVALLCSLLLVLLLAGPWRCAGPVADHPFFEALPERPWVVAHRGGEGPENTIHAFRTGLAQGADLLEMDVRTSADGILLLLHDETVDRTTDGSGAVADLTLAELKALDAAAQWSPDGGRTFPLRAEGIAIPTLAEALAAFPRTPLLLDLKAADAVDLCTLIRSHDSQERVLVVAHLHSEIAPFRQQCPEVATGLSRIEGGTLIVLNALRLGRLAPLPAEAALFPMQWRGLSLISPRLVATARQRNLSLFVWTVDEPQEMRSLLDLGIDGLITTYPERVRLVLSGPALKPHIGRKNPSSACLPSALLPLSFP
jgi:glycerophosphoryl diester phosphodiesterase